MIHTGSLRVWRKDPHAYDKRGETWILVTRYYPWELRYEGITLEESPFDERARELAPRESMLHAYKEGEITVEQYRQVYTDYITNDPEAMEKVRELAKRALRGEDIRLFCHEQTPPCHRFWLEEVIEEKAEELSKKKFQG